MLITRDCITIRGLLPAENVFVLSTAIVQLVALHLGLGCDEIFPHPLWHVYYTGVDNHIVRLHGCNHV